MSHQDRTDISNRLVHLTKGETEIEAAARFLSIVSSARLLGGTGYIRGGYRCVCLSEAPIANVAHALSTLTEDRIPYAPFGVMIDKHACFQAGGRPVIYQPESEYLLLPESMRFRHKRYEPGNGIDFSWEREWRVRTDAFALDPAQVTLVVPHRAWADHIVQCHADELMRRADREGAIEITKCPWHVLVLEDIGIRVPFDFRPERGEMGVTVG